MVFFHPRSRFCIGCFACLDPDLSMKHQPVFYVKSIQRLPFCALTHPTSPDTLLGNIYETILHSSELTPPFSPWHVALRERFAGILPAGFSAWQFVSWLEALETMVAWCGLRTGLQRSRRPTHLPSLSSAGKLRSSTAAPFGAQKSSQILLHWSFMNFGKIYNMHRVDPTKKVGLRVVIFVQGLLRVSLDRSGAMYCFFRVLLGNVGFTVFTTFRIDLVCIQF